MSSERDQVGVYFFGARGDVATAAMVGAAAIGRGLVGETGLVTALPQLAEGTDLAPLTQLCFGGLDVRLEPLLVGARRLAVHGVVPGAVVEAVADVLETADAQLGCGVLGRAAEPVVELASEQSLLPAGLTVGAVVDLVRVHMQAFQADRGLARVVAVQLTSAEPSCSELAGLEDEACLDALLERPAAEVPSSLIYALSAFAAGCSYVNFTPGLGASSQAMEARARRLSLAHAGRDGKTGETLLKSVLAPMFAARHLEVLSWAGYNILGNRDGLVLNDPAAKASKLASKRSTLGQILGDRSGHSEHVTIDYVPSMGDWKTAWDHVHFAGFMGTQMALELTWRGCDTALAAPLVLDCVRLVERAVRAGHSGVLTELACFFKDPLGCEERAFAVQWEQLCQLASAWR